MSTTRAPESAPDAADARAPTRPPGRAAGRGRRARAPGVDRPAFVADAVKVAAWLSIAAGAIHAVATVDHFSHWWLYGVFFLSLAYGQVLWGVAVLRRPVSDRTLRAGAIANLAIVAAWLFSRTIGVPFGPEDGRAEPVGIMDVAAQLDQIVLVAYVAAILNPALRTVRGVRTLLGVHRVRIGMMLCSASFFASVLGGGHSH